MSAGAKSRLSLSGNSGRLVRLLLFLPFFVLARPFVFYCAKVNCEDRDVLSVIPPVSRAWQLVCCPVASFVPGFVSED
jgi:hypothetical protein